MANIHTFGSTKDKEEDKDKNPDNEYYAGGRSSGVAVQGRDGGRATGGSGGGGGGGLGLGSLMGRLAESVGAQRQEPEEDTNGAKPIKITMTLWANGIFSLDDGESEIVPRNPQSDPASKEFLETVFRGQIPMELHTKYNGQPIDLVPDDKHTEEFQVKKRPMKMFSGGGRRLGDVTPNVTGVVPVSTAIAPQIDTTPPPKVEVDPNLPITRIQIRLADGTRLVSQFNPTQPVSVIRNFVGASRPDQNREYSFMTTFPNKVIDDETQTIEAAGLKNSVLVQKMK